MFTDRRGSRATGGRREGRCFVAGGEATPPATSAQRLVIPMPFPETCVAIAVWSHDDVLEPDAVQLGLFGWPDRYWSSE